MTRLKALAAVVAIGVTACGNERTPNSLRPAGEETGVTTNVWWYLLTAAAVVAVVVIGLILWGALRPRRQNPGSLGDDAFIAIGGVGLPAVILISVGVVTVAATTMIRPAESAPDALRIEIVGHQWWWEVVYTDLDVVTANEVTLPADRPVELSLRTADVIHSFWVPELAGKQDLVPGTTNRLALHATRTGTFTGVCAEFCGIQHAGMGITVIALDPQQFEGWVRDAQVLEQSTEPLAARGREVFQAYPCGGCHRVAGTAEGDVGPDLTDLGDRTTLAAGMLDNTPENLARFIRAVQDVKPGAEMLGFAVPDDEMEALVAFLEADR